MPASADAAAFEMIQQARTQLLAEALRLVSISVAFGLVSGVLSVSVGLFDGSLAIFGVGLGVLADVAGSGTLIWRFRAERHDPARAAEVEARATVVIVAALALISAVLSVRAIDALAAGTHPGDSAAVLSSAALTAVVLTPLAYLKRHTGVLLASPALKGDGTLSAIGAATALFALVGLLLYRSLDWWWADRVVALIVACAAAAEAYAISRTRHH